MPRRKIPTTVSEENVTVVVDKEIVELEKKILIKGVIPLKFLPSVNEMYKRGRGGKVYLNPDYKIFKEELANSVTTLIPNPPKIDPVPLQVTLGYYSNGNIKKSDVDNMNKATLDSLMSKYLGIDDSFIYDLYCYKRGVKGSTSCFLYFKVETIPKSEDQLTTLWDKVKESLYKMNENNTKIDLD